MHASDSGQVVLTEVICRGGNGISGAPYFVSVRDTSGSTTGIKKCVLAVLTLRKPHRRCRPASRARIVDWLRR